MTQLTFKRQNNIESVLLLMGAGIFMLFFIMYVTQYDLRRLLFGTDLLTTRERIGVLGSKQGEFRRKMLTTPAFRSLEEKSELYNHDTVVTGNESSASLELYDGSVLELGPRTMIKLSFDSGFTLKGIGRKATVQIVSGKVKAQTRTETKNIVVKFNNATQALLTKPNVADVIEVPEPSALQVEEANPTPKVTETAVNLPPAVEIKIDNTPIKIETLPQVIGLPEDQTLIGQESTVAIEVPKTTPSAVPSTQVMPEVKVSAKPELNMSLEIIQPKPRAQLQVQAPSKVGKVTVNLHWRAKPAKAIWLNVRRRISDEEFQASTSDKARMTQFEDIFSKVIPASGRDYRQSLTLNKPGIYEWELKAEDSNYAIEGGLTKTQSFMVKREAGSLKLMNPLIAGQEGSSNRYSGKILKDFDVSLSWEAIQGIQRYRLRFYRKASGGNPFFDKEVSENSYQLNRKEIPKDTTFFEVTAFDKQGFYWQSSRLGFRFDFSPPFLKNPKDRAVLSHESLKIDDFIEIFTWERTNFTLSYDIEIARDPEFKNILLQKNTTNNFMNIPLKEKGSYYWRVKSIGNSFTSVPSPAQRFDVN